MVWSQALTGYVSAGQLAAADLLRAQSSVRRIELCGTLHPMPRCLAFLKIFVPFYFRKFGFGMYPKTMPRSVSVSTLERNDLWISMNSSGITVTIKLIRKLHHQPFASGARTWNWPWQLAQGLGQNPSTSGRLAAVGWVAWFAHLQCTLYILYIHNIHP